MSLIGIVFALTGLGFLCWALFKLAIYAFPVYCGLWVALGAYHSGAGLVGAVLLAPIAGTVVFAAGQLAFTAVRSTLPRIVIALVFSVPAFAAGYQVVFALTRIGTPSQTWSGIFAVAGGVAAGATALARLTREIGETRGSTAAQPLCVTSPIKTAI